MILMFEIDPPFRWKPEIQRIGVMTRFVWGWFAASYVATGIRQMAQAFREDEREECAKLADARAMRCEKKTELAEDEDEVTELHSLAWQFSMLAAEMRGRSVLKAASVAIG